MTNKSQKTKKQISISFYEENIFIEKVKVGLKQAKQGKIISHGKLVKEFRKMREKQYGFLPE